MTCLVPAFFIAGAIMVFVSQAAVIRYFGAGTRKILSYSIASVSGAILAVCSCTVLPLFGGIYKRGAGIGPAVAFLYSGPAINVLAIVYSARLLGYDLGLARAIGAVSFSVVIGLLMAGVYGREERDDPESFLSAAVMEEQKKGWRTLIYFALLVVILISGASKQWLVAGISLLSLAYILYRWFTVSEFVDWLRSTTYFVKQIFPWLILGVFIAGILRVVIPESLVGTWLGGNSLRSNFVASLFGALMYFATLTEVPIIKAFMELGMGKGPALALLLAGPALSLPNMLVIRSIMGTKKTLTYVALVVIMATATGIIFGNMV
jgi:uncharacterized membrane protein YraQ (UPF0718 family)